MTNASMPSYATLLQHADDGDAASAQQLFASLYSELHQLAERQLRRGGGITLGATTLLHETYLAIAQREASAFPDKPRFLAFAAKAMRNLIIDYARARRAQKRGGEFEITRMGYHDPVLELGDPERLEAVADALERLALIDAKLAEVVDLHFFCGFSLVEIAALREVTDRTVQRDWRKARILLENLMT